MNDDSKKQLEELGPKPIDLSKSSEEENERCKHLLNSIDLHRRLNRKYTSLRWELENVDNLTLHNEEQKEELRQKIQKQREYFQLKLFAQQRTLIREISQLVINPLCDFYMDVLKHELENIHELG